MASIQTIYIIGYKKWSWVPAQGLSESLKRLGYTVFYKGVEDFKHTEAHSLYRKPHEFKVDNCDLVIVCQTHYNFKIITKAPILYYHTEWAWYPSCENPDYIIYTFPETIQKFERYFPRHLENLIDDMWFGAMACDFLYPEILPKKRKKGIHYMGNLFTDDQKLASMRDIYSKRGEIVATLNNTHILDYHIPQYNKKYLHEISSWEAGLVVDGKYSYYSPRAVEYSMGGVVPFIYVGEDHHWRDCYESMGFVKDKNCFFFTNINEVSKIYFKNEKILPKVSSTIRVLAAKRFSYKIKVPKLMQWLDRHEQRRA